MKRGYVRVAGVTTDEIRYALLELMWDRGLRSLSQAVGTALQEWFVARRDEVVHPADPSGKGPDTPQDADEVPNPRAKEGGP